MLTRAQYDELQAQYERTPDISDSFAPSGEHYRLYEILRRFGFVVMSREEAMTKAADLLSKGYR